MTRARKKTILLLGIGAAVLAWMWYQREKAKREAAVKAAQMLRTPPPALV